MFDDVFVPDAADDGDLSEDGGPPGMLRQGGCQCAAAPAPSARSYAALALLALLALARRRRR
jgi:MYXO-CTERM domain-containing protein